MAFFDYPKTQALLQMGAAGYTPASRLPTGGLAETLSRMAGGMGQGGKDYLASQRSQAETADIMAGTTGKMLGNDINRGTFGLPALSLGQMMNPGQSNNPGGAGAVPPNNIQEKPISQMSVAERKIRGYAISPLEMDLLVAGKSKQEIDKALFLDALVKTGQGPQPNESVASQSFINATGGSLPLMSGEALQQYHADKAAGKGVGEAMTTPATPTVNAAGDKVLPQGTRADQMGLNIPPRQQIHNPGVFWKSNPDAMAGFLQTGEGSSDSFARLASPYGRLVAMSEGWNPAKNPMSAASGYGQFLDTTWEGVLKDRYPALVEGATQEQIRELKKDPGLQAIAIDAYADMNAAQLAKAGLTTGPDNLLLAHQFGAGGAIKLLQADPKAPIESVVVGGNQGQVDGKGVVAVNPNLRGKTVQDVLEANKKLTGLLDRKPGKGNVEQQPLAAATASTPASQAAPPISAESNTNPMMAEFIKKSQIMPASNQLEVNPALREAQTKGTPEYQEKLNGDAEAGKELQRATAQIFAVLRDPNFDPRGAQTILAPVVRGLLASNIINDERANAIINAPQAEVLQKELFNLVTPRLKNLGERAVSAVSLQQQGFPNPDMQKNAQILMTSLIRESAEHDVDKQKAFGDWMRAPENVNKTHLGFEEYWNRSHDGLARTAKAYESAQKTLGDKGITKEMANKSQYRVLLPAIVAGDPESERLLDLLSPGTAVLYTSEGKTKPQWVQ